MAITLSILTLSDIKAQCRIESDFTLEDSLLTSYGVAAEEVLAQYLGRGNSVAVMVTSLTEDFGCVPEMVKNAALMLVDLWYQHRSPVENISMSQVPYTFDMLIKPYMKL